jgi:SAM-dependent methyltransferase
MTWYERAFGEHYLQIYAHRDLGEAAEALAHLFPPHALAGRRVLDLACGGGRYLRELYVRGAHAVGLDLSWPLLKHAQREFVALRSVPLLVRADMKSLPFGARAFDLTLSMFTSFGYFERERDHQELAAEMGRVTRTVILLDVPNPAAVQRELVPESERTVDGWLVRERRWLEQRPLRVNKTVHVLDARSMELIDRYDERVRLFQRAELSRMFSRAGFRIEASYGGYRAEGFRPERSPRMILRLRREVGSVDPR